MWTNKGECDMWHFEILIIIYFFQARHNGQNYVFALLTGYRDPPAGVTVSFFGFNNFYFNSLFDFDF